MYILQPGQTLVNGVPVFNAQLPQALMAAGIAPGAPGQQSYGNARGSQYAPAGGSDAQVRALSNQLERTTDEATRKVLIDQRNKAVQALNQARTNVAPAPPRVTYAPPGVQAPTQKYNYTPTKNGAWSVAVPGVMADVGQEQYSSDSSRAPAAEDQLAAQQDYIDMRFAGLS